ncbi:hypothetical protein KSP39_PZI023254 [Platanthera zijinensis]|uniref:VHS domain-containing protein n=1 Tax=Platanthera zijinensis TaxID=2320716 RepID=A0AAP0AUX7_9ASPA
MAAEMVKSATSEKLMIMDWAKNIEICELVAKDERQAKDVIKCIKKRLGHKNATTQLFTVRLLEMLIYNCGEHIHRQLIDNGLLRILVKIVKKKTNLPVRERIFLLLDATQTSLGGDKGKFPQYYAAYYDLVASRVQFPQRNHIQSKQSSQPLEINEHSKGLPAEISKSNRCQQGAADEFILDLVEQCSFQKQRVMHLVMTCHDEQVIAQAIELNELLDKVLAQHDSLLSIRAPSTTGLFVSDETKEDEELLLRRICKGKALAEDNSDFLGNSFRPISDGDLRRPLSIQPTDHDSMLPPYHSPVSSIPPPPLKHIEREKFFKEKHSDGSNGLAGHVRRLSIHSRTGSSSRSCSTDFSDMSGFHDRFL